MKKIENIHKYVWIELAVWLLVLCAAIVGVRLYKYHKHKQIASYQIFLQDADGLIVGSPVKFMGVQIGYIDMLRIVSNDVYVRFLITDKDVSLPSGAIAAVEFSGLGGSKSLEIYPPTAQSIASDKLIYIDRPKRLHDALELLNDMYTKIDSIVGRLSYFINETDVVATALEDPEKGLHLKEMKQNFEIFSKWVQFRKEERGNSEQ
jgi:hypothetical protein